MYQVKNYPLPVQAFIQFENSNKTQAFYHIYTTKFASLRTTAFPFFIFYKFTRLIWFLGLMMVENTNTFIMFVDGINEFIFIFEA